MYWLNLLEAISQFANAVHAGDPNQTFSARVASYRGNPNAGVYWKFWIWAFETFWAGHLDWAAGPD